VRTDPLSWLGLQVDWAQDPIDAVGEAVGCLAADVRGHDLCIAVIWVVVDQPNGAAPPSAVDIDGDCSALQCRQHCVVALQCGVVADGFTTDDVVRQNRLDRVSAEPGYHSEDLRLAVKSLTGEIPDQLAEGPVGGQERGEARPAVREDGDRAVVGPEGVVEGEFVYAEVHLFAALVGFDGDEVLNLGLAVREAAINAIKHGNKMDPMKKLSVVFEFDEDGLSIAVRDKGKGFDPNAVVDPTLPENLLQTSGRGILLMKAFVDRVEVHGGENGKGAEVLLFKCLRDADGARQERA